MCILPLEVTAFMNTTSEVRSRTMLGQLVRLVHPSASSLSAFLLVALLAVASTLVAWKQWAPLVDQSSAYRLIPESIQLGPERPSWVKQDIKAAAIDDGKLTELSLRDPQLVTKVRGAFLVQSWVATVKRVFKHAGGVEITVVYRRPVALVEVVQGNQPGLLPIDADAVCLPPDDFSEDQVGNYIRVVADNSGPAGPIGTNWGDQRIQGGARIADAVSRIPWKKIGLYRVESRTAGSRQGEGPYRYHLVTRDMLQIRWGYPPGQEADGEATADQKVQNLLKYTEQHGPLSDLDARQQLLDLRDPAGAQLLPIRSAMLP